MPAIQAQAKPPVEQGEDAKPPEQEALGRNTVSLWQSRITRAKAYWKNDFKRMRDNMNFAAGLQKKGQKIVGAGDDYKANITLRAINTKVAQLYARNPKVEFQRRKRMSFQLYDGRLETIMPLVLGAMQNPAGLAALPPPAQALLADFAHGMQEWQVVEKVGKTLEYLLDLQWDEQDDEAGSFKTQAKQLVRRVITTCVGYCRIGYSRENDASLTSFGVPNSMVNRAKQAKLLLEKVEKGEIDETHPDIQQLQSLFASLSIDTFKKLTEGGVKEGLVYDFLPATSVIPDIQLRSLKGFIGARWLAIEYNVPLSWVNAIFETQITLTGGAKEYTAGQEKVEKLASERGKDAKEPYVCLWEVLDKEKKSCFFLVDGWKDFVQEPQPLSTYVRGFWPLGAITFNDVEVEEGMEATPFPPSDVELMKSAQLEWNRSRDALKKHRKANAPGYLAAKGMLTEGDKETLQTAPDNAVTELEGVPQGTPLDKVIIPRASVPINPQNYDTAPQLQDILMTGGLQQENIGPTNPKGTATGQTLAAQAQLTVTGSNIDDLDDFLSWLARVSGEVLMREMQKQTVVKLIGPGAVWPEDPQLREEFINQIYLSTKAASSGKPNQQLNLHNWQIIAPILQAAGANPMFLVRESIRRLDDQLDPEEAFPLIPPAPMNTPQGGEHQPGEQEQHKPGVTAPPQQNRPGPGKTATNKTHNGQPPPRRPVPMAQ